jgi:hypothetical protein
MASTLIWLIQGDVMSALYERDREVASYFFQEDLTYEADPLPPPKPQYPAMITNGYTSCAQLDLDIEAGKVPPRVALRYDNESWGLTPTDEQNDPAKYMTLFAELAHLNGHQVILTPALDLMKLSKVTDPPPCQAKPGESSASAFLRCGIPGKAAAAAKAAGVPKAVYDVQSQSLQATRDSTPLLPSYKDFTLAAATQAHETDPDLVVIAGLTTQPSDVMTPTAANLLASALSVLGAAAPQKIAGFWLNCTAGDPNQVGMAVEFLTNLKAAGY